MSTIVNTFRSNPLGDMAVRNYGKISAALSESRERLTSGSRILNSPTDFADVSAVARMSNTVTQSMALRQNIQNLMSFAQTQGEYLRRVLSIFTQMNEMVVKMADVTKPRAELENYLPTFQELASEVNRIRGEEFNGLRLFLNGTSNVLYVAATASDSVVRGLTMADVVVNPVASGAISQLVPPAIVDIVESGEDDGFESGVEENIEEPEAVVAVEEPVAPPLSQADFEQRTQELAAQLGRQNDAQFVAATQMNLGQAAILNILNFSDSLDGIDAGNTGSGLGVAAFSNAVDIISSMLALNGAEQTRMRFALEDSTEVIGNIMSGVNRITDVDVGIETERLARFQRINTYALSLMEQCSRSGSFLLDLLSPVQVG